MAVVKCAAFIVAVVFVVDRPREGFELGDALNQGAAIRIRIRNLNSPTSKKPKPREPLRLNHPHEYSTAGWTTMMWWRLIVNHAGMATDVLGRAGVMIGEQDTSLAGLMSRGSGAGEGSDRFAA